MSDGWVRLYRQIAKNELWLSEPFTDGQAWVDLLLLANHAPGTIKVRGVRLDVERGQVGWSEVRLAERWKWSRGKVRRFLHYLEEQNMVKVVQQKNCVSTLITVVNYERYQSHDTADDTANGQQKSKKKTKEPSTLVAEGKVDVSGVMMTPEQAELFNEFWQAYPKERRTGKGAVVKAWMKHNVDALLSARMVQALERLKLTEQWQRDGGRFIPLPATWLNQRRWEDDVPEDPPPGRGKDSWKTGIFAGVI